MGSLPNRDRVWERKVLTSHHFSKPLDSHLNIRREASCLTYPSPHHSKLSGSAFSSGTPCGKSGVDMSNVHPVATGDAPWVQTTDRFVRGATVRSAMRPVVILLQLLLFCTKQIDEIKHCSNDVVKQLNKLIVFCPISICTKTVKTRCRPYGT